jgi:hypothetical protein
MFVVTPSTVVSVPRLRLTRVGAQLLGRGLKVIPRRPLASRAFWRIVFDQAPLRYVIALSPFPVAMAIRPDLALAISQAPLLMFAVVFLIESSVLSVQTPEKRRGLISEAEAARGLDQLQLRAREGLSRIAAGRDMADEELHLVVEQSGLARVPVLTLVSVQIAPSVPGQRPVLLDLTKGEREVLETRLFDADFPESLLHVINLAENRFVRDVAFEARAVSAHARLRAKAERRERAPA